MIVGKTNSPEIGLWPFTEGPAFGATRNPWSLDHSPGGSSGGAAAAVAAGLLPAAVGSDGAGSVRIPAAWTNLVGVKPQRGRISTWPDAEAFNGLTVIGPLARTVADAALLLDLLGGNRDGERHRPPPPPESFLAASERGPGPAAHRPRPQHPLQRRPRRARPRGPGRDRAHRRGSSRSSGTRSSRPRSPTASAPGVSIMPRSMTGIREWVERCPTAPCSTRASSRAPGSAGCSARCSPSPASPKRSATAPVGRVFRRFDVVLSPTSAQPPLPIGACEGLSNWETDKRIVAACPYAWPWNVLGWPGVNVPAGFTDGGLPIGAQLLGPANSEPRLLSARRPARVGRALARAAAAAVRRRRSPA